jgi:hypothetical protein
VYAKIKKTEDCKMSITIFCCPHCRASLGKRHGLRSGLEDIGPSMMICPNCGLPIKTGAHEWTEMPIFKKLLIWTEVYLYYGALVGPLFASAAGVGVTVGLKQSPILGILVGLIVWVLVMVRVHKVHQRDVQESLKRKTDYSN